VPFEYVQLVVASTPQVINSGYADAQGAITLSGVLPAELSVGDHTLALFAPSSGRGLRQTIAVTQAMTGAAMLPATGSDRRVLMWLGLGSLMLGVRLVRRPRSSQLTPE
jgi:LPXTG-motif cell wall-anchored protein